MVEPRRTDPSRRLKIVFRVLHGFRTDRKAALVGPQDGSPRYTQNQTIDSCGPERQVRISWNPSARQGVLSIRHWAVRRKEKLRRRTRWRRTLRRLWRTWRRVWRAPRRILPRGAYWRGAHRRRAYCGSFSQRQPFHRLDAYRRDARGTS